LPVSKPALKARLVSAIRVQGKCDEPLSNVALNVNVRCYTKESEAAFKATDMFEKFQCDPVDRDVTDAACYGDRYAALKSTICAAASTCSSLCTPTSQYYDAAQCGKLEADWVANGRAAGRVYGCVTPAVGRCRLNPVETRVESDGFSA